MNLPVALDGLPAIFTGGVGLGAGLYFAMWFLNWLGARLDKKEAAVADGAARIDAATQKLIDRLQAQIDGLISRLSRVEAELDECRQRDAQKSEEIARLRGVIHGLGEARQHAATIVAQDRVTDRLAHKISEQAGRKEAE